MQGSMNRQIELDFFYLSWQNSGYRNSGYRNLQDNSWNTAKLFKRQDSCRKSAIIVRRRSRTRPLLHSRWLNKEHYIKTNCNISIFFCNNDDWNNIETWRLERPLGTKINFDFRAISSISLNKIKNRSRVLPRGCRDLTFIVLTSV